MLSIQNLSKIYQLGSVQVPALQDVSLQVTAGDMICIMGKSGSGKSTLLRQLGLIDFPTSGQILLNEQDVTMLSEKKRSHLRLEYLGYVFQEYALLPEMTAEENVYLPAMMRGARKAEYQARAREVLELVDLSDRITHRPKELSGGEQQRVAIARALVNEPEIIFADEPCANLDTISSHQVMETLANLNKQMNVTIIFVSHDPDDKQYAQRTVYLKDGNLVDQYM